MTKISDIKTQSNIDIPEDATKCAITLFIDSLSAGQTSDVWDLSVENCMSFGTNAQQGCAYMKDGKIIIENVIAYIVFFK